MCIQTPASTAGTHLGCYIAPEDIFCPLHQLDSIDGHLDLLLVHQVQDSSYVPHNITAGGGGG